MLHPELDQEYKPSTHLVTTDEDGEPLDTAYTFTRILEWEWKRVKGQRGGFVRVKNALPFGYAEAVDIVLPGSEEDR